MNLGTVQRHTQHILDLHTAPPARCPCSALWRARPARSLSSGSTLYREFQLRSASPDMESEKVPAGSVINDAG
jgi:hypothetical protein